MDFLVWLHVVGAALWLGGMVSLGVAVVVAFRSLQADQARLFIRNAGRAFAGVSVVAWLLLGATGLLFGAQRHWPLLVVEKIGLALAVLVATVAHTLLGMRTRSRPAIVGSRVLSVLILLGTLLLFWFGVRLA